MTRSLTTIKALRLTASGDAELYARLRLDPVVLTALKSIVERDLSPCASAADCEASTSGTRFAPDGQARARPLRPRRVVDPNAQ